MEIDDQNKIKAFWLMPVYHYGTGAVKCWELTIVQIMKDLKSYSEDEDYGSPSRYDIVAVRMGQGQGTRYSLKVKPPKPAAAEVKEAWAKVKPTFDLSRIWKGGDVFGTPEKSEESDGEDYQPFPPKKGTPEEASEFDDPPPAAAAPAPEPEDEKRKALYKGIFGLGKELFPDAKNPEVLKTMLKVLGVNLRSFKAASLPELTLCYSTMQSERERRAKRAAENPPDVTDEDLKF